MPEKSFEIDSNPPKVGSEQIGVKTARLQVVSRCERDLFRKRRRRGTSATVAKKAAASDTTPAQTWGCVTK